MHPNTDFGVAAKFHDVELHCMRPCWQYQQAQQRISDPGELLHRHTSTSIKYHSHEHRINVFIIIIIIPTYAYISSVKLILKLLRHVSVLIRHLQTVYSYVS